MTDNIPASKRSDEQIEECSESAEEVAVNEIEVGKDSPYLKGVSKSAKKVELVGGIRI